MIIKGTILAVCETEYWEEDSLDNYGIADAFGVYMIPHDGAHTVDVAAYPLENVFMFYVETPDHLRDDAIDHLQYPGGTDYLMRSALDVDARFRTPISVEVDDEEEVSDYAHALMQVVDGFNYPSILSEEVWRVWSSKRREKLRAVNHPPIANFYANGLTNLPLFVAAGDQLCQSRKAVFERVQRRYGGCAGFKVMRDELRELGWA